MGKGDLCMLRVIRLADTDAAWRFYMAQSVGSFPDDAAKDGMPTPLSLMPVTRETVDHNFWGENRVSFGAYEGDALVGLISGVIAADRRVGYLSYLCVGKDVRRRGIASALYEAWEVETAVHPAVDKLEVVFYNPVQLPWYIPHGNGDWHPCLPGVDKSSGLYLFLKNRGWRDFATQNVYYRRMSDYEDGPGIAATRERLFSEGIELTLYDPAKHRGLPELFDNIGNPGWKAYVLAHLDLPVVVAVDRNADGLVVGYTGPLSVVIDIIPIAKR